MPPMNLGAGCQLTNTIDAAGGVGQSVIAVNGVPGSGPGAIGLAYAACAPVDGFKNTYSAAFTALSAGVGATTDLITIFGSSAPNRVVRVIYISLQATIVTTAVDFDVLVATRKTFPSGGTPSALTIGPVDQRDPAATVTGANFYTAAPTAGTGTVIAGQKLLATVAGTIQAPPVVFNFAAGPVKAPVLAGSTSLSALNCGLAITLNGVTPGTASSFTGFILFTEETVVTGQYS